MPVPAAPAGSDAAGWAPSWFRPCSPRCAGSGQRFGQESLPFMQAKDAISGRRPCDRAPRPESSLIPT